jgi:uncharacterized protein DUF2752
VRATVARLPLLRVGLTYAGIGLAAIVLAAVHIRRPATVCVLRSVTGVPCPFCGGTTAAVDLGRGHVTRALGASPLAVLGFVLVPVKTALAQTTRLPVLSRTRVLWGLGVALLASELFELHRFHLIWA